MGTPWRLIKGVEPDALKGASPVLNGGDEETGLCRPRLVATQLECGNSRSTWGSSSLYTTFESAVKRCWARSLSYSFQKTPDPNKSELTIREMIAYQPLLQSVLAVDSVSYQVYKISLMMS
jgi:hypothetical protein